jgi:hypothetical protein
MMMLYYRSRQEEELQARRMADKAGVNLRECNPDMQQLPNNNQQPSSHGLG